MKIGVSSDIKNAAAVKAAGYDYFETALSRIAELSEAEFESFRQQLAALQLPLEVVNGFFCAEPAIVGPDANLPAVRAYAARALDRARRLGVKIAVFGNGSKRRIPQGADPAEIYRQIDAVVRTLAEEGEKAGILIVVEHLRREEDNAYTTLQSVLDLVRRLNLPNVKALVDFYHLEMVDESLEVVRRSGDLIAHAHVACHNDRHCPREEDRALLESWRETLDACGYTGRVTIEAWNKDFENEIRAAVPVMNLFRK